MKPKRIEVFIEGVIDMKTVAYLRVSSEKQQNGKFEADILRFSNKEHLGTVEFIEETVSGKVDWKERKLGEIVGSLEPGDNLIVPELSRLGRSTIGILEVLRALADKGINVHAIKGRWRLDESMQSKLVATMLALIAEIEADLISSRTKEALAARRAAGVTLGRPRGPGKSKLDAHRDEITAMLSTGSTVAFIARRYGCAESTVHNWLRKRGIERRSMVR